jgi:hypothetical protein
MLEWPGEVGAAAWIVDRLHPFARDLGSVLPEGFAAYARLRHPAWRAESGRHVRVTWAELAAQAGVTLHATTRFEELERTAASQAIEPPEVGTLDERALRALVERLAASTATPQACWLGWWEGYGWMQAAPAPAGPRVEVPERPLVLYRGPIDGAAAFGRPPASQSPNLWWPDDHAWCVASEIDFRSTYLGGSRTLIDRVLDDERFEALPARPADRVTD